MSDRLPERDKRLLAASGPCEDTTQMSPLLGGGTMTVRRVYGYKACYCGPCRRANKAWFAEVNSLILPAPPEPDCDHDAPRRGYYGSKCSACGQDFLARDIR